MTTSWTMVLDAPRDAASLEAFLVAYWSPVYAYIRRTGRSEEDAADLTQSFFASLLESPRLLETANPDRGKFRTFLLTATKNFLIDEHRREYGRDGVKRSLPMTSDVLKQIEPSTTDDPALAFDRQWATTVLNEAIRRLEASCLDNGLASDWEVFEKRVLCPTGRGNSPAPIEQMMRELNAQSPQQVYSMIQTMKRRLNRQLLEVVSETVGDPVEAGRELRDLLGVLGR